MEYKSCSDKYIWSADDSYFYKGLSELIVDIDELIYLSLEKIRKDFVFINLNTASLNEFIREMKIIRMTAQGMQPKSIARIENCSVKTVYTHRRNAEAKLYSKIYKLVQ
ncbi:helix-turn-helix transcriptional regulator [Klebsiella pneumoniae]